MGSKKKDDSLEGLMKECQRLKGRLEFHLEKFGGRLRDTEDNEDLKAFFKSKAYSQTKATISRLLNSFKRCFGNYRIYEARLNELVFEFEEAIYGNQVASSTNELRNKREANPYSHNSQGGLGKLVYDVTSKTPRH
ncbi:MAG: hypothetical protein RL557_591 [archaeon]|jgi:hypothetical protein